MDPNAAYQRLKDAIDALIVEPNDEENEVIEAFDALDQWLCRGGFLPDAWNARREGPR